MRRLLVLFFLLSPISALYAADSVDLLWQGSTYTPPFYLGRALWSNESAVTLAAVANIANFNPATLYYRWTKDGTVLGSRSGINKTSITFVDSVLSLPIEVKIDVRDGEDGKVLATNTITLTPTIPQILIFENNPFYGLMMNRAIANNLSLKEAEITLAAIPLFARVNNRRAEALDYTWRTNTGDVRNTSDATYRVPEGASGSSAITVRIENSGVLAQPLDKSFSITFGKQAGL